MTKHKFNFKKKLIVAFSKFHEFILLSSKGKLMKSLAGYDMLLLETTGRVSGSKRRTPLLYLKEEKTSFLCVASFGGSHSHPDWFLNIRSNPKAQILIKSCWTKVYATILENQDRKKAWNKLTEYYPSFNNYQSKTKRIIPVVQFTLENKHLID